jgi:hypothetical protein
MNELAQNSQLKSQSNCAIVRTMPAEKFENLVRRLNKLQSGRYLITLTVGRFTDYTITELGKVEG